jgi:hypothetical protein
MVLRYAHLSSDHLSDFAENIVRENPEVLAELRRENSVA